MQTRLILKPGERGTRKLTAQHGDRLVCVRYRYDVEARKRFKTVELIVEEAPWAPTNGPFTFSVDDGPATAARQHALSGATSKTPEGMPAGPLDPQVAIKVGWEESELREKVKGAGAKWSANQKVWRLNYAKVVELGLEGRIAPHAGSAAEQEPRFAPASSQLGSPVHDAAGLSD